MSSNPVNFTPNRASFQRSVSKIGHQPTVEKKPKKTMGVIQKYLKSFTNFLRRVFQFKGNSKPTSTVTPSNANASTETIAVSKGNSKSVGALTTIVKERISEKFSGLSLDQLITSMNELGLRADINQLNSILKSGDKSKLNTVDTLLSKVTYHQELQTLENITNDPLLSKNGAVQHLDSLLTAHLESFKAYDGQLKDEPQLNSEFYDSGIQSLNNLTNQFKSDLKTEFSSANSSFRLELSSIKHEVLKSTESYVKSGEFEQKKLVGQMYQSLTQLVNYAIGKRKNVVLQTIKNHVPQHSNESNQDYQARVDELFVNVKNLYAEKHFHLMASTLQGDQYLKGWSTQGRSESEIMRDVEHLCSNNDLMNELSQRFDSLLQGLDAKITGSSNLLVKSAFQNDSMMASMKSIHEMTKGFEQFVDSLGVKDLSKQSLDSLSSDIKQTYQMMDNFKALSKDFVVGEHSLTHLGLNQIKTMVSSMVTNIKFENKSAKNEFIDEMSSYVMSRLEYKGAVDKKANDFGTIHKENLDSFNFKDSILIKMDAFKKLNEDKSTSSLTGRVVSRGPFNKAFDECRSKMKNELMQHINSGNDLADNDISRIVSRIIVNLDCNVNNVDYRSEIITMLTQYTSAVLKKTGVIATGDVGLIKEATPQTMTSYTKQQLFGGGESFVLKSKKSDFLNSHLYTHYQSQFDSIQVELEKNINDTLKTGLQQGQAGKVRMIVKELKSRPRKPLSETISFKSKVVKNRILSFFSSENLGSKTEMLQSLYTAKNTVDSVTDQPIVSSDDPVGDMREKLNKADTDATDSIESSSESANQAIDSINQQIGQVQNSIDDLLNSEFNKKLFNIQGKVDSGKFNLEKDSAELKSVVSSVESQLTQLKTVLVQSGNIALDQVDDILMSVPYIGEIYSALSVANDIKNGYFASQKMDAMKEQINTVNDFNRYVISDSLTPNSASSEVKAFTTYMKSEKQRDEATFSLLIHVGNALSPPGLNVGSVLKAVKSVVKLPDLDDKEMDKIATEVMTVNKNYKALTAQAKNDGLNDVLNSLDHQDRSLSEFTAAIYDVSYHLPTAQDFSQTLTQRLFK